jgi:hypothetical protein
LFQTAHSGRRLTGGLAKYGRLKIGLHAAAQIGQHPGGVLNLTEGGGTALAGR